MPPTAAPGKYRALAGDVYECWIVAENADGTVNLLASTGAAWKNPHALSRIRVGTAPGTCRRIA